MIVRRASGSSTLFSILWVHAWTLLLVGATLTFAGELCAEQAAEAPPSDSVAAARRHFERGVGFYRDGHFEAAIAAFGTSYDINPLPQVLFNIAIAQRDAGHNGTALATLRRYVALAASEPEDRREMASALIEELDESLATVSIQGQPLGSRIFVNGESLGHLPLDDPLRLCEGEHEIELRHPGYQSHLERLELTTGEVRDVEIQLTEVRRRWYRSWWFWTIVGVVAAGTVTGVTLGLTAEPEGADFGVVVERGGSR